MENTTQRKLVDIIKVRCECRPTEIDLNFGDMKTRVVEGGLVQFFEDGTTDVLCPKFFNGKCYASLNPPCIYYKKRN